MLTSIGGGGGGGGRLVARRGSRLCPWRCALTPNPAANRIIIYYISYTHTRVHLGIGTRGAAIQMPSLWDKIRSWHCSEERELKKNYTLYRCTCILYIYVHNIPIQNYYFGFFIFSYLYRPCGLLSVIETNVREVGGGS